MENKQEKKELVEVVQNKIEELANKGTVALPPNYSAANAPVSYTHLDVYKRQESARFLTYNVVNPMAYISPLFVVTLTSV